MFHFWFPLQAFCFIIAREAIVSLSVGKCNVLAGNYLLK